MWKISKDQLLNKNTTHPGASKNGPDRPALNQNNPKSKVISSEIGRGETYVVSKNERDATRRVEFSNVMSNWFALASQNASFDIKDEIMKMVMIDHRCSSWGSIYDCSHAEQTLHESIVNALVGELAFEKPLTRPILSIGGWAVSSKLSIFCSMMIPAVSTMTFSIPVENIPLYNYCRQMLLVVLPSSKATDGVKLIDHSERAKQLLGRLSSSVVGLMENMSREQGNPTIFNCIFCNIGSTRLIFKLICGTKLHRFMFGSNTAMLLFSTMKNGLNAVFDSISGILIYVAYVPGTNNPSSQPVSGDMQRTDKSCLYITLDGDVRFQGSTRFVRHAFDTLSDILVSAMTSTSICNEIVASLQPVSF